MRNTRVPTLQRIENRSIFLPDSNSFRDVIFGFFFLVGNVRIKNNITSIWLKAYKTINEHFENIFFIEVYAHKRALKETGQTESNRKRYRQPAE